jgi:hypothetical protein
MRIGSFREELETKLSARVAIKKAKRPMIESQKVFLALDSQPSALD